MSDHFTRVFLAFAIPAGLRTAIVDLAATLPNDLLENCRLSQPDNLHFTLHYFGYLKKEVLFELDMRLTELFERQSSFTLHFNTITLFPNRRPRVLVLSSERHSHLQNFIHELRECLQPLDLRHETRRFQPHITLGRMKKQQTFVPMDIPDIILTCHQVNLLNSTLTQQGPQYQVLRHYKLTSA